MFYQSKPITFAPDLSQNPTLFIRIQNKKSIHG